MDVKERQEAATEAQRGRDGFAARVSILVAVLAVVTAGTSSLENTETAGAITQASRAVLSQDQATDQWGLYQAKSLKKNLYDIAAASGGTRTSEFARKSTSEASGEAQAQAQAKVFETARDHALEASEKHERRHHRLALAATLLEIGIAISTIAIITRQHWPWAMAAGLGVMGLGTALSAYF